MDTSTPQIYTLDEWRQNNQRRFNESDNTRSEWFRVKEQSKQLMQEKQILTSSIQITATEKLSERAKDIREWKNKLERCLEAVTAEIKRLELLKTRLWSSLDKADKCAIVARECLDVRKLRISTDLVEDYVQRELLKEAEMIEMYRNLTQKYINESEEQLRKDYAAKNQLERDWSDKWEAYSIDATCSMMKLTSSDQIASYPGPEDIPSKWSTPKEWVDFTRENIKLCTVEVEASKELAYLVEQHVKRGAEDIQRQSDIVLAAFHRRNIETNDCLYRLREHLTLVGESIASAEKTVNNLRTSILEKEPSLKKVQTRLHLRYGRPNVELCHDPAQEFLVQESRILSATIQQLQEQLVRAEAVLRNLQETRRDIEREIAIKENSVAVDQVRCSRIRQKYPQKHDLYGY